MNWVIVVYIAAIAYSIIVLVCRAKTADKRKAEREMYDVEWKEGNAGYSAKTSASAGKHLKNLSIDYSQRKEILSKNMQEVCESTISDLRDNFEGLIADEWIEKADNALYAFLSMFGDIANATFSDVDKAYMHKNKCLSRYDKYWEITRGFSDKETSVTGHTDIWERARARFIEKFLSNDYFTGNQDIEFWGSKKASSLSPREQIDRKLTKYIEIMRPEYKRKMRIYDDILEYVYVNSSVPRSEFVGASFDYATEKEVESCYRGLVRDHRLLEIKLGGRFFAMLSDKEAKKRPPITADVGVNRLIVKPQKKKTVRNAIVKTDYTTQAYMNIAREKGLRYIDRRNYGGCLWVEASDKSKPYTQGATVDGKKFVRANSAKCFNGYPGWYLAEKVELAHNINEQCRIAEEKGKADAEKARFLKVYSFFSNWPQHYDALYGSITRYRSSAALHYRKYSEIVSKSGLSNEIDALLKESCKAKGLLPSHGKTALDILIDLYVDEYRDKKMQSKERLSSPKDNPPKSDPSPKDKPIKSDPAPKTSTENYSSIGEIVKVLRYTKIRLVDKTDLGGCLWIESSSTTDNRVKKLRLNGVKPRMAKSSRYFYGKPAWYFSDPEQ